MATVADPAESMAYVDVPVQRLVRVLAPVRIVLFGSHAKGRARPGSDVDLLVVVGADAVGPDDLRRARQLVDRCFPPVDVSLCTVEDLAGARNAPSPFLASIVQFGITVYERSDAEPPP